MIFVDLSGNRWKRLKRSALLSAIAVVVPVAVLVVGGYTFNPQWSALTFGPLHASAPFVPSALGTPSHPDQLSLNHLPTGQLGTNATSPANSNVLGTSTTPTISTTPTGTTTTDTTGTTTTTPSTTAPAPSSSNANGGNSDTGRSHHFN